jgi:hypothetical protein
MLRGRNWHEGLILENKEEEEEFYMNPSGYKHNFMDNSLFHKLD